MPTNIVSAWTHGVYTLEAMLCLVLYEVIVVFGFSKAHRVVRRCPTLRRRIDEQTTPRICAAVAEACVWHVRKIHCLERSVVATWLLRLHGVPAELIIGVRYVPVQSHAWVEVQGQVVNDRPQYQKFFQVLERL
jgi:hypothetical protein